MTEHDWLILSKHGVTPTNLNVYGLNLNGQAITALPEGLVVHTSLGLVGTPLTTLPVCLCVGGGIDIHDRVIIVSGPAERIQAWIVAVDMRGTPLGFRYHRVDCDEDEVRITGYQNTYSTDGEVVERVHPMIWGPCSLLHQFGLTVEMRRRLHHRAREIL